MKHLYLNELADHIERLPFQYPLETDIDRFQYIEEGEPEYPPTSFNMGTYRTGDCGCIVGHALHFFGGRPLEAWNNDKRTLAISHLADLLDMDFDDFFFLSIGSGSKSKICDIQPNQAANAIRLVVEGKSVQEAWEEATSEVSQEAS